jgi:pyruvate dehydrogenase E1 component alpha subunit
VSAEPDIHKRASAWRMRGEGVDGMDVLKVYDTAKSLIEWIRAGNGPVLLEAYTYRFRGHSMSDAATYRTKDEVEQEKQRDPILTLRAHLLKHKAATEAQLDAIDEDVRAIVEEALAFADQSPEPPLEDVYTHHLVGEGEEDEKPRARVRGATDVKWPSFPTEFEVTWELEPRHDAPAHQKKGAA